MSDQIAVMPALRQPLRERERTLRQRVRDVKCRLHRSRREDDRYMIFDLEGDATAAGNAFELTLDDVESWIDTRHDPHPMLEQPGPKCGDW